MHLDRSLVAVQVVADQCVMLAFFNSSKYVMLPFICEISTASLGRRRNQVEEVRVGIGASMYDDLEHKH